MSTGKKKKVHLIGGDSQGWALDVDLRMTREALTGVVELVDSPFDADVIHSVNAEMLIDDPRLAAKLVPGKKVVVQLTSHPMRLFEQFPTLYDASQAWTCVAQSREAFDCLKALKVRDARRIPYVAELKSFFPVPSDDARLSALREELRIPAGKYLIGSFVRDSLGQNLARPKPQKGADVFAALVSGAARRVGRDKLHVLLAGPRRHWLRGELDRLGISYTFDGTLTEGDDNPRNILPLERLNLLINLIDLYVIPSRWEGAPAGLFHVIAAKKKVISTDIAAARDVLPAEARFDSLPRGIDLIVDDVKNNTLASFTESNHSRVLAEHTPEALRPCWREIYDTLVLERAETPSTPPLADLRYSLKYKALWKPMIVASRLRAKLARPSGKSITMWGEIVDGPYGGANQVMKAMMGELRRRGFDVHVNSTHDSHGHIMNSAFFDRDRCKAVIANSRLKPKVIHRIDGPISIYRGQSREQDAEVFRINREVSTGTAFQCLYSWEKSLSLGFDPVKPMIIRNAVDPALFFQAKDRSPRQGRKLQIVSSSWSTNPIKGFDIYEELDRTLDFSRYEYTFVGRSPVTFKNIRMVEAQPSAGLGEELRSADLYITASLHDPASNSLNEALNCGLPALYRNSGGHGEIAGFSGLPFHEAKEIPALLAALETDYDAYLSCRYLKSVAEITDQYLQALELR